MVFARPTRRSDDDRLVDRFTRHETPAQHARRIARARVTVPKEVIAEFDSALDADTPREARAIAQSLTTNQTHTQTKETPMTTHTKRTARTRKAELAPATPKPTAKPAAKVKAKPKVTKKATAKKPTERVKLHAKYTARKLQVQRRVKLNATVTYHGRNETLDGKPVKVIGYEGRGGVFVEFRGERYVVSPHALLKEADVEKES